MFRTLPPIICTYPPTYTALAVLSLSLSLSLSQPLQQTALCENEANDVSLKRERKRGKAEKDTYEDFSATTFTKHFNVQKQSVRWIFSFHRFM